MKIVVFTVVLNQQRSALFHKAKFGVRKAFLICFEMATSAKGLSTSYMGACYEISQAIARIFMYKVREIMSSNSNHLMDGDVHINEFVIGGKESCYSSSANKRS